MELKPSKDKQGTRRQPRVVGVGAVLQPRRGDKNPFGIIAQGTMPKGIQTRRRWTAETLGATPPRDGPFAPMAATVAKAYPPKGRKGRYVHRD